MHCMLQVNVGRLLGFTKFKEFNNSTPQVGKTINLIGSRISSNPKVVIALHFFCINSPSSQALR